MMLVGGKSGGIHGAHMGAGAKIRYAAAEAKRQTIPWVEYTDANGKAQTFVAAGAKDVDSLPKFDMQCVDCHNRPAHSFKLAARAVDEALASGTLPASLPFRRRMPWNCYLQAIQTKTPRRGTFRRSWTNSPNRNILRSPARTLLRLLPGATLAALYQQNVFPDLKVTWGTYPNNLGHTDAQGCFRCHHQGDMRRAARPSHRTAVSVIRWLRWTKLHRSTEDARIADRTSALQRSNSERK